MDNIQKIGIFIPAFNEEDAIISVLNQLSEINKTIPVYIIDDGSIDTTANVISDHGFTCLKHPINLGGGAAIKTAFTLARELGYRYVLTLDADGQHDPSEIPNLWKVMKETESGMVIGSRFVNPEKVSMQKYRAWGIRFFSWYTSFLTGQNITDVTSCYRVYDMNAVKEIIDNFHEKQYYAIGLVVRIAKKGVKITEVPIADIPRVGGDSKKGILRYLYNLIRVILKMTFSV